MRSSACECVFSRYRKDGRALQQSEKVGQTSTSVNHSRKEKRDMEKRWREGGMKRGEDIVESGRSHLDQRWREWTETAYPTNTAFFVCFFPNLTLHVDL